MAVPADFFSPWLPVTANSEYYPHPYQAHWPGGLCKGSPALATADLRLTTSPLPLLHMQQHRADEVMHRAWCRLCPPRAPSDAGSLAPGHSFALSFVTFFIQRTNPPGASQDKQLATSLSSYLLFLSPN